MDVIEESPDRLGRWLAGYDLAGFGVNDYGAKSNEREGCIVKRDRSRWEIRLAEGEERRE